jgi:hypothetical protein
VDVLAQHLDAAGTRLWGVDGIRVIEIPEFYPPGGVPGYSSEPPAVVSDGADGIVIGLACADLPTERDFNVRAQHITANGNRPWGYEGILLCRGVKDQLGAVLTATGSGNFVAAWKDNRNGSYSGADAYAQGFDVWGYLGDSAPAISSVADVPHDQGGFVALQWTASYRDTLPDRLVRNYSIWRRMPASSKLATLDGRVLGELQPRAKNESPGERTLRVLNKNGQLSYWEYVISKPATALAGYSAAVPTTSDSLPGANPLTLFLVQAEGLDGEPFWSSPPDSGYSVDNLAPAAPNPFAGSYGPSATDLSWGKNAEADFAVYRLYASADPNFVPSLVTLLSEQSGEGYAALPGGLTFKLIAVDVHGNASGASVVSPSGPTGVEPPTVFAFAPLGANPSGADIVNFALALPRSAQVRIAIYDLAGRRVRQLVAGPMAAGEHVVHWDLRDDRGSTAASAVYLVQVEAGQQRATRRVTILH